MNGNIRKDIEAYLASHDVCGSRAEKISAELAAYGYQIRKDIRREAIEKVEDVMREIEQERRSNNANEFQAAQYMGAGRARNALLDLDIDRPKSEGDLFQSAVDRSLALVGRYRADWESHFKQSPFLTVTHTQLDQIFAAIETDLGRFNLSQD